MPGLSPVRAQPRACLRNDPAPARVVPMQITTLNAGQGPNPTTRVVLTHSSCARIASSRPRPPRLSPALPASPSDLLAAPRACPRCPSGSSHSGTRATPFCRPSGFLCSRQEMRRVNRIASDTCRVVRSERSFSRVTDRRSHAHPSCPVKVAGVLGAAESFQTSRSIERRRRDTKRLHVVPSSHVVGRSVGPAWLFI